MISINGTIIADKGFFISLPESTDRLNNINDQIETFNIEGLTNSVAIKNTDIPQSSPTVSHLKVFSDSLDKNLETILVLEDDFQIYPEVFVLNNSKTAPISEYLPILFDHINSIEWDIILLGFNGKKKCIPISSHLSKNFKSTGAWGYLINRRAREYILNNFHYSNDRMAIDDILPYMTYRGFNSFVTNAQIVHHGKDFVSTMQPSFGKIDYSEWITGNYHNSIWQLLSKDEDSFYEYLEQLYSSTHHIRESTILLQNFNGDIGTLQGFIDRHPQYSNMFIEIENTDYPNLGYYLSVESGYLFHRHNQGKDINNLGKNLIQIDLDLY